MPSRSPSKASAKATRAVRRLLPYAFLCTIGPSVTAATALYIARVVSCRVRYPGSQAGDDVCRNPDVGALTASIMTGLATLDGVTSFLSSSAVQTLADKYGRRPVMLTLPLLAMVSTASMMLAYIIHNPTIDWVFLAATGMFVAASTKCVFIPTLVVADVANEQQKTRFYSRLEALSLLGPGFAFLISALSSRYIPIVLFPYFIALGSQLLASIFSAVFMPETLKRDSKTQGEEEESEEGSQEGEENEGIVGVVEDVIEIAVEPIKPLGLLLPRRDEDTGKVVWSLSVLTLSLLSTTFGTIFIATASLLFLSDKFDFQPEGNAWVLAFLTFSKFVYIVLIFPLLQRSGRRAYHWYNSRRRGETKPLLSRMDSVGNTPEEANHFDVILLFVSVCFDAVGLILVSLSKSYKQALVSYALLALGSGDNPTYKSVFTSLVPASRASSALAALDMVWNAARLLSPFLLGSLYAILVEAGKPELLFLVAGGCCALGAVLLIPLIFFSKA